MVGAKDLIAEAVGTTCGSISGYRAGANDFISLEPAGETREALALAAPEAKATVALAIGNRRAHAVSRVSRAGARVDSGRTTFLHVIRKAEGAYFVAIGGAVAHYIADILLADPARVAQLETYTVTVQAVALTIGDTVIDEAASLGA